MSTTAVTPQAAWSGRGLPAALDFATRSHARAAVVLVLFSFLAFLPGSFQIPPIDRDEARFAQASKQMIESGNYVDIRFQGETRYKKPVGIYWLQSGVVQTARALGMEDALTTIWLYRIPSLLGAIGAVLLTYWTALAFLTRRGAVLAGLMLAGSVLLGVEARLAKTDAMLLFTVVAAMGAMARIYLAKTQSPEAGQLSLKMPAIFWTALAAGVLLKGPIILMIIGLTAVTLFAVDRSFRWLWALRPGIGLLWFLLLVLPWFVAIVLRSGDSFFVESVGHDMLGKVAGGQETHGAPPGTYFVLFWLTFWPAATLAGLAVPAIWRSRRETGVRFLLAWLVPSWLVFEIVPTKLPHYVLPLFPAVAILLAICMVRAELKPHRLLQGGLSWWFVLPLLLSGAALAGVVLYGAEPSLLIWPLAAAAVTFGLLAWWFYRGADAERALLRSLIASVTLAMTLYMVAVPSLPLLFPSAAMADVLRHASCRHPQAAAAGFAEPSLVFLAGTSTQLTDGAGAADFLSGGGCRFAFVERKAEGAFRGRAAALGLHYSAGAPIEAFNYNGGRRIRIAVFRSEAPR